MNFDRFQEPEEDFDPCEYCRFDCSITDCEFKTEEDEEAEGE